MEFDTKKAYNAHLRDNLWEGYIKRDRLDKFRCDICGNKFHSKKAFFGHWDDDHEDKASQDAFFSDVRVKRELGDVSIRVTEKELIKTRIRADKSKQPLKDDVIVNDMIREEFEYGVAERAMTTIEILGIPGVGKSVLGLSFARHLQILWTNHLVELWNNDQENFANVTKSRDEDGKPKFYLPTVRIGSNMFQTTRHIKEGRMGDIVIQDEDPGLIGANARSIKRQIENLLKIMRKECINLIFISPIQVSYVANPTMVIEVVAKDIGQRVTYGAYYDRQINAHGWVIVEILQDNDPLMKFYLKVKDLNIEKIKQQAGKEQASFDREEVMADVQRLYAFITNSGIDLKKGKPSLQFLETMCWFIEPPIKGNVKYIETVCRTLRQILDSSFIVSGLAQTAIPTIVPEETNTFISSNDEFIFELEEVLEDKDFLDKMYELTPKAVERKLARGESLNKYKPKHAEAWYLIYARGYTMQAVAEELRKHQADDSLTDAAIANPYNKGGWRAVYQEEVSGDAAEETVKAMFYPEDEWEIVGGYGKPDIVNTETNAWVEVKLRNRLKPKEPVETQLSDFEYQHVRDGNDLILVRIGYVAERCRIEFWKVSINTEWYDEKSSYEHKEPVFDFVEEGGEEDDEE